MGIFPSEVKDIIFTPDEIEPARGEIEMNIGKLGNSEKLKFPFWVEGTFGDNIWWGGVGGPDWGGGSGGRRGDGRDPDGTGSCGQECQMAGEGGNGRGRRARWQLLGLVGQEGGGAGG